MLTAIGLTAGEAFIVLFLATFIITAHYWPKVGAWLMVSLTERFERRHASREN